MTSRERFRCCCVALIGLATFRSAVSQDSSTAKRLLPLLKDPDPTIRISTVRSLGQLGRKDDAAVIVRLLEDEDGRVRWEVAGALKALCATYEEGRIAALLRSPRGEVRADAAFALAVLESKAFGADWKALLADPDPRARAAASFAIGQRGRGEFATDVSLLLDDKDARVRWAALSTLRKLRATAFDRAVGRSIASRDPVLRWSAWETLLDFGAKSWIAGEVEPLLADRDSGVRADALLAAGLFDLTSFASKAAGLLEDPDPRVRYAAVVDLHRFRAVAFLNDVLKRLEDPDPEVRRAAAAAIPALEGKKSDHELPSLASLGKISRLEASTVFAPGGYARQLVRATVALESPTHWSVALSLGKIPAKAGVDDLDSLLSHPLPEVRRSAVWILDQWASPGALRTLRSAADREQDPSVSAAFRDALDRARGSGSDR